jgi:hypothetical protein
MNAIVTAAQNHGRRKNRQRDAPVGVCRQVILNVSASIVSTPELPGVGDIRAAMAWMEWKVEARMR